MKKILIALVVIVLLAGGWYLYTKKGTYMGPQPQAQQESVTTTPAPTSSTSSATITVIGNEFAFSPSKITLTKGTAVTIVFKNQGHYPHNFTVAELGVKTATIQPGETTSVTFTPDKTGTFTYECTVPGHADRGMTGSLTVQ